ncbi:MAG: glutathione S-transferase family protein [Proteobacteria bacterium]|nr:glutathione S-transferase family protein [Pseudomonadota bacterium]
MGMLVEGQWVDDSAMRRGGFHRPDAPLRNWVTADGSSGFKAEAGRYHLYISYACPWAHRALIVRRLKKLEDAISLSVVDWHMTDDGWHFSDRDGAIPDPNVGAKFLREVYIASDPAYTGRVTVPVLWDKKTGVIVNNESSEIIRMFNDAFSTFDDASLDLYPADKRAEIDALNDVIYDTLNNGVYKCGFGGGQVFYEESFDALFATLDDIERRLARQRYLVGDVPTEADWRLFPTLVRFDAVYFGHFKCNLRRIADYPHLSNYLRDLYQTPGIAETVNMHHIKSHYYHSHTSINPTGIVPKGPALDLDTPHDRGRFADDTLRAAG